LQQQQQKEGKNKESGSLIGQKQWLIGLSFLFFLLSSSSSSSSFKTPT